ncbi:Kunitz/Bovine pancreatic trypsin inhibitor domain protein, partial [Cooperia oncophora]
MSPNSSTACGTPPIYSRSRHMNTSVEEGSLREVLKKHHKTVFIRLNGFRIIYWLACCVSAIVQILFTLFPLDFRILYLIAHISLIASRSEVCWDKFDMNYRNQCLNGHWQQRFYFDHASLTCRQFWYDGCRSDSRNMFEDHLTCQWLCESQPMYKSSKFFHIPEPTV